MNIRKFVVLGVAIAFAVPASADAPVYTMTAFADNAHGEKVLAGDYDLAIERLTRSKSGLPSNIEAQTNLCVAYVKSGALDLAQTTCDKAVTTAEKAMDRRAFDRHAEIVRAENLAIALSNRGVLKVALGESVEATADFERAEELETRFDAADINLARLAR